MKSLSLYGSISIALLLIFLLNVGFVFSKGFLIEGKVSGAENLKVYLSEIAYQQKKIDSSFVLGGKFVFKGSVKEPQQWQIKIEGVKRSLRILVDNEKIQIEGAKDNWHKASIIGAKWQKEWDKLESYSQPFYSKLESFNEPLSKYETTNPQLFKLYMDSLDIVSELRLKMIENYVSNNSGSFTSLYAIVTNYLLLGPMRTLKMLKSLTTKLQNHELALAIFKEVEIMTHIEVGKPAPIFKARDSKGEIVDLAAYKGKYVLLDFWASWCGPCRAEVPNLKKIQTKYADKGLVIIGISVDKDEKKWLSALEEDKPSWTQLGDLKTNEELGELYGIRSYPNGILIDSEGIVVGMGLFKTSLAEKLVDVFEK